MDNKKVSMVQKETIIMVLLIQLLHIATGQLGPSYNYGVIRTNAETLGTGQGVDSSFSSNFNAYNFGIIEATGRFGYGI